MPIGGYNGVVVGNAITPRRLLGSSAPPDHRSGEGRPEIAREAIAPVCALFRVEKEASAFSAQERLRLRQSQPVPVFVELREKLLV